jgi:hypothetical protein
MKKMNYYSIKYNDGKSIAIRAATEKEAVVKFHKHTHGTIKRILKLKQ